MVGRFSAAAQRYEAVLKNVEARRNREPAKQESHGQYSYPNKASRGTRKAITDAETPSS
jgi:hypothetical protein